MSSSHIPALEFLGGAVIRILAAYLLCYALGRLASRATVRHILWLVFLAASCFYWLAAVNQMLDLQHVARLASSTTFFSSSASTPRRTITTITIPHSWKGSVASAIVVIFWIYVAGAAAMLIRFARRRLRLRDTVSQARLATCELEEIFVEQCRRLRISRCLIRELPGLSSPGTAYVWKPVVIMPEGIDAYLDNEQIVDVLYHELMHVKRLDFLWNSLAELVACLLFFHPAVWLALRNLSRDRELACDMAVMNLRHGRRQDYALCLTRLARRRILGLMLEPPRHLGLLDSFLAFRVKTLLAERRRHGHLIRALATAVGAAALFLFAVGWPLLTLAVNLAGDAPRIVAAVQSPVRPAVRRLEVTKRSARTQPHVDAPQTAEEKPEIAEVAAQPAAMRYSPVSPSLDGDPSGEPVAGMAKTSRLDGRGPSVPTPGQSAPSWRKTAAAAAVGALGQLARGRRDGDGDGDADDRTSRRF
jgi:beta-lactamase regulating signal transducer with metallopeptidase domain